MKKIFFTCLLISGLFSVSAFSFDFEVKSPVSEFYWDKKSLNSGIQPAASGRVESGLFGMVRNDGQRFHEGIDIKSFSRDGKGRVTDRVIAACDGIVVHVCRENNGSYGKYVVIEHKSGKILFYTLYAHLNEVSDNLEENKSVRAGEGVGIMGNTSSTYKFKTGTEHLHFEVGLRLGQNSFNDWYKNQFPADDKNLHSFWNGLNLSGIDPVDFLKASENTSLHSFKNFLDSIPVAFSVVVSTKEIPEIIYFSPGLLAEKFVPEKIIGWKIDFSWNGTPLKFKPLTEVKNQAFTGNKIVYVSKKYIQNSIIFGNIISKGENFEIGKKLSNNLKIIFGMQI